MILYHGTNTDFKEVKLNLCTPHKDFGRGFYLTPLMARARERAKDKCEREHKGTPIVQKYEFDEKLLGSVSVMAFTSINVQWLDFILENRNKKSKQQHTFDIVIGPVADDGVITSISLYEARVITRAELIERLKYPKPFIQYCFCTQRAIDLLKRL